MQHKYKLLKNESLYNGYHNVNSLKFTFELFNGGMSETIERELFIRKSCVAVLPYDPNRKELVLIEQIRPGPIANNHPNPWLLEIVAGIIEPDEDAISTVNREAKEEANCNITKLIPIYDYYVTPGCSTETVKLYCGLTDCSQLGGIHGVAEEGEDIKCHVFKLDKALDLLHNGKIINAATIISLQWLALNYKNLG